MKGPCKGLRVSLPLLNGPRLTLRPARLGDLDFLADLNSDVDVMKHISGRPLRRSETEEEWTRRLGPRSANEKGLGYWVGSLGPREIGWWGLGHSESEPTAGELGFRIRAEHWRQGLGKEGTHVLLDHAFCDFALDRVWAGTVSANTASQRALESVGMRQTDEPFPGVLTYEIKRSDWLDRGGRSF